MVLVIPHVFDTGTALAGHFSMEERDVLGAEEGWVEERDRCRGLGSGKCAA